MNRACFRSGGGYGDTGYTWQHEGGCDGSLLVVLTLILATQRFVIMQWQIETLFGVFQQWGFCLESTHLAEAKRLSCINSNPSQLKSTVALAKSLFRTSFDYL